VIAGGTAVRLLLAAVLEVRDHATQQVLASTHIQLYAMDAYDYNDCVRRMSGVFLLNRCIDVDSVDVDLRLQICDIDDPPTMMVTVYEDQQTGQFLEFVNYFEEPYMVGGESVVPGDGGDCLFQDPVKSKWIDLEAGAITEGGGVSRDTPHPVKCMVLRPCYNGEVMVYVTHRYPTSSLQYAPYAGDNAWDDGLALPRMGGQVVDWSDCLVSDPDYEPIMLPLAMVNLDAEEQDLEEHLRGDKEFGPDWDLGYDKSHIGSPPDSAWNVRALHTYQSTDSGPPGEWDYEPMYMSTTGSWPDVWYNVLQNGRFLFLWDGRQQTFVDIDAVIDGVPQQLRAPGTPADGFQYDNGVPLYLPPGTYTLKVKYNPAGYPARNYPLKSDHNISFAYSSALCVNALGDNIPVYPGTDKPKYEWIRNIPMEFHDALLLAGYCSQYYSLNRPKKDELSPTETSGFITSLVSYQPILVVDAHDSEAGRWNCLDWSDQQRYKKDFVLLPFCWSWRYRGLFSPVGGPRPSCFIGWDEKTQHDLSAEFCGNLIDYMFGPSFNTLGYSWKNAYATYSRTWGADRPHPRVRWGGNGKDCIFTYVNDPLVEIVSCDS